MAPVDDDDSQQLATHREVAAALREAAEERAETAALMRREAEAARAIAAELRAQAERDRDQWDADDDEPGPMNDAPG